MNGGHSGGKGRNVSALWCSHRGTIDRKELFVSHQPLV